jgi:hypothetical protein
VVDGRESFMHNSIVHISCFHIEYTTHQQYKLINEMIHQSVT